MITAERTTWQAKTSEVLVGVLVGVLARKNDQHLKCWHSGA